jgi:predicted transcriptional regulator
MPTPTEIRAAREQAGLTQSEAAVLIGNTRVAWTRYEAGTRSLDPFLWRFWKHVAGIERIPFRKR